jgi:hypothetical protein
MCPKHSRVLPRRLQGVWTSRYNRFNNATQVQLITHEHGYSGDTTHQNGTTVLTIFSIAGEET